MIELFNLEDAPLTDWFDSRFPGMSGRLVKLGDYTHSLSYPKGQYYGVYISSLDDPDKKRVDRCLKMCLKRWRVIEARTEADAKEVLEWYLERMR